MFLLRQLYVGKRAWKLMSKPVAQMAAPTGLCFPSVVIMPATSVYDIGIATTSALSAVNASSTQDQA